jgi:anti-sigma factor RsiW
VAAFAVPFTPERCDATGRFGFGDSSSRGALAGGRTGHLLATAALVQRFRLRLVSGGHTEGMSVSPDAKASAKGKDHRKKQ